LPLPEASPLYKDLSDWVVNQILDSIKAGQLQPGERLIERQVAERFGVSRAPVRDAIHKLERLGVIVRDGARATHVRSWTTVDVIDLVTVLDSLIALSARLAAERLTPEQIVELENILEQTRQAVQQGSDNVAEQVALDVKFHVLIARASGNRLLADQIKIMWLPWQLHYQDFLARVGRAYSLQEHEELLDALKQGDPDVAEACCRRHAVQGMPAALEALAAKP
jgi:DNA-binding GntR family transcriptional regulator